MHKDNQYIMQMDCLMVLSLMETKSSSANPQSLAPTSSESELLMLSDKVQNKSSIYPLVPGLLNNKSKTKQKYKYQKPAKSTV